MSSYIHPDNQQLLWNIANSNSILSDTFSKYTPTQKDEWFKSVIEVFYKKIGDVPLTKSQLHQHNKDTLAYMIQLSHRNQYSIQREQNQVFLERLPDPAIQKLYMDSKTNAQQHGIYTPPILPTNREEIFTRQFQEREREYKAMLELKAPEVVDFREHTTDTAINNMDELIRQHQKEREQELQIYRPAVMTSAAENITLSAAASPPPKETSIDTLVSSQKEQINNSNLHNVQLTQQSIEDTKLSDDFLEPSAELTIENTNGLTENVKIHMVKGLELQVIELTKQIFLLKTEVENMKKLLTVHENNNVMTQITENNE
jgi:hypothetical protein